MPRGRRVQRHEVEALVQELKQVAGRLDVLVNNAGLNVNAPMLTMNLEQYDTSKLGWLVGIHLLFLGSLLTVVLADRISAPTQHPSERRKTAS